MSELESNGSDPDDRAQYDVNCNCARRGNGIHRALISRVINLRGSILGLED